MVNLGKVLEFKGVDHTIADEYPSYLIVLIMSMKNSIRHKGEKIKNPFFFHFYFLDTDFSFTTMNACLRFQIPIENILGDGSVFLIRPNNLYFHYVKHIRREIYSHICRHNIKVSKA